MPLPVLIGGARERATRTLWAVGNARVPETRKLRDKECVTCSGKYWMPIGVWLTRSYLCHIFPFKELIVGFKVGGERGGRLKVG